MAEDQQRLLSSEPTRMRETETLLPPKAKRRNRKTRDILPSVKFKWSRIIKSLASSGARLRHRIKPGFRLALCVPNPFKSSRKEGSDTSPLTRSHLESPHNMNHRLLRNDSSYNSARRSHLGRSSRGNPRLSKFPRNHMLTTKEKPVAARTDDHSLPERLHVWQDRVNRALANIGPHKSGVPRDVPKGCIGVYVGPDHTRFIIPIVHLNHPLFASLFDCMHDIDDCSFKPGPLRISCDIVEFQSRQSQLKQLTKR